MSAASEDVALNIATDGDSESSSRVHLVKKQNVEQKWWQQFHWSRIIFVCLAIACIACAAAYWGGQSVPNILVGFFLVFSAGVGFALVWNYAVTKSLAESADSLEKLVIATEDQLEFQRQNNLKARATTSSLEQVNNQLSERLVLFEKSVSLLGEEVKGIAGLEGKMAEMIEANSVIQARREDVSFKQRLFLLQQQIDDLNRLKDDIKRKIRDQFDEADRDRSGYIDSAEEIKKMKEFLMSEKVTWQSAWDSDGDGKIERYELMEGLEKVLEEDFAKRRATLTQQKQEEEARAAAFRATQKLPAEPAASSSSSSSKR